MEAIAIAFQTPPLDFYKNIRTKFNPVGRERKGFPGSSAGKESTCNAGNPGSIHREVPHGEGIGYPLQYSWASPVAQTVRNLPAMWETWV